MKPDRFLTGILIGISVLIVLSLTLFFLRRETVEYRTADAPENVVHNYVLAIERQDYERAYQYLAEMETKPSYSAFRLWFFQELTGGRVTAEASGAEIIGDEAIVSLTITRPGYGLFASPYHEQQSVLLTRQNGEWKIRQAPWPYWGWDWSAPQK